MDASSISMPLAFMAGGLSFVSPCVLPLVPVYLGYLSGSTVSDEAQADRWNIFAHALCFVAGFTLIFVLLFGLPTTLIGGFLSSYNTVIARIGGVLVIVFGLHTTGLVEVPFLNMTKRLDIDHGHSPGFLRSALVGMAFAAGWSPCIGPLLGAVMTLALNDPSQGVVYTLVYAAGLAVPFLVTALLLTQATDFLRRMNRHARIVQWVSGLFLIGVGLLLLTGQFAAMNAFFIRFTPDWLVEHI